jgi:hypothetical protein
VALNEAELHDTVVRADIAEAMVVLRVLALPQVGPEPDARDRVLRLRLTQVGRVAASLRLGRWDDEAAVVEPFALNDLSGVVTSFGVQPIYGWEFFDPPASSWDRWRNRLSLDVEIAGGSQEHVVELFQESGAGPARHLDFRIWFNGMAAYDLERNPKELLEVAAAGKRWWEAMYAGDPRTQGHGIASAGRPPEQPSSHDSRTCPPDRDSGRA